MTISAKLYTALTQAPIVAIVGNRIYPLILPQTPTYPALSYQRISNTAQIGSTELRETRYQINCWASTYATAQQLATAVKTSMEEYKATATAPRIKMAQVVNELDDYDPDTL